MKFIDLNLQYQRLKTVINANIQQVLDHSHFILGSEVKELESHLANYADVQHCVTTASGTDALLMALMALGIKQGDEVITTPFSFFSTAEVILLAGASPVFVDINPKTYLLDPHGLQAAITNKTKAIMPVDLYGQCADYDAINQIAKQHGLCVIADAAQSFGATYKNKKVGGLATITCTSFFPTKPLGCYGDGGACFTNDDTLAESLKQIRVHGQSGRYQHVRLGINGRLDTLQAAVLLAKLTCFDEDIAKRQEVATRYQRVLHDKLQAPHVEAHNQSVFAQYTIEITERDRLQAHLNTHGIPTMVHYPTTLPKQAALSGYACYNQHFPKAERAAQRVLSLPIHPDFSIAEQQLVVDAMLEPF